MDAAILRAMSSVTKTRTGQMLFITTPDRDQKVRELWPYWQACELAIDQGTPLPEGWWAKALRPTLASSSAARASMLGLGKPEAPSNGIITFSSAVKALSKWWC